MNMEQEFSNAPQQQQPMDSSNGGAGASQQTDGQPASMNQQVAPPPYGMQTPPPPYYEVPQGFQWSGYHIVTVILLIFILLGNIASCTGFLMLYSRWF